MSLFHIATVGNTLTIMSVSTGYTIERKMEDLTDDVVAEISKIFNSGNLQKPQWTRMALDLDMSSAVRQYYMYERAEELRAQESEYLTESAMSRFADFLPKNEYAY